MGRVHFIERYQAGEHLQVWRELIDVGDGVVDEPLRSEAILVCEEIVRRARFNLRTLHDRLLDLGYEFAEPHAALIDADADAAGNVDKAERELGAFPLIARIWYRTLASLNFRQADHQLVYRDDIQASAGPDIFGLGSHPVLIFQSLDEARKQLLRIAAEEAHDISQIKENAWIDPLEDSDAHQHFFLGGVASNCESKGFPLPSYGVDAVIYDDGGGETYFVDELRKAFRFGGFPFWQWSLKKPKFYSPMEYRPNFAKLLPVLREGLLEL